MRVISLGWGRQSFALAAMAALGELPLVDVAIHADTTHERSETYAFAERWTPWLEARGVRVVTVHGKRNNAPIRDDGPVLIPAFTTRESGAPSGMLRRQCTYDWKVAPIRRWLQKHRAGARVEMWLGITLDEVQRVKAADVKYLENKYPLIEQRMSRQSVNLWLERNGLEIPPKSACVFCPFHDLAQWREIQRGDNGDWQRAVEIDEAIRHKRPGYIAYLAAARVPLVELDLRDETDHGQLSLWDNWDAECEGMCGV